MFKKSIILFALIVFAQLVLVQGSLAQKENKNQKPAETSATPASNLKGGAALNVNSDQMDYFEEKDQIVATGNVKLRVDGQNTTLEADKITYDRSADLIIAENNVKIIKNKQIIRGDYTRIDLIRNSVLIDHPNTDISHINIDAKTAKVYPKKEGSSKNNTDITDGNATINDKNVSFFLSSSGVKFIKKNNYSNVSSVDGSKANDKIKYKILSKKIIVNRYKDKDVITLLNSKVKANKYTLAYIPSVTISKDSETSDIETNLPEIGQRSEFGWYYGYGHVFGLPNGATLKAAPLLTNNHGLGIGGLARLRTDTNRTLLLYSSKDNKILVDGEQKLPFSPKTKFQYGINSYIENGIMWKQRHNKIFELVDNRKLFSTSMYDFDIRSSAGYIEQDPHWGTGRFQLQGDMYNTVPLLKLSKHVAFGTSSQFATSVYGNGDTYGVLRAGPTVSLDIKPVYLWMAYYQGGIFGETPFAADRFYYGKSNLTFNSTYRLHKFVSIGYLGSLNLSKDNWDNKLVAENQIYCWFGPDDLKFRIGYDTRRKETTFDFNMIIGADRSNLKFDKMKIIEN